MGRRKNLNWSLCLLILNFHKQNEILKKMKFAVMRKKNENFDGIRNENVLDLTVRRLFRSREFCFCFHFLNSCYMIPELTRFYNMCKNHQSKNKIYSMNT